MSGEDMKKEQNGKQMCGLMKELKQEAHIHVIVLLSSFPPHLRSLLSLVHYIQPQQDSSHLVDCPVFG